MIIVNIRKNTDSKLSVVDLYIFWNVYIVFNIKSQESNRTSSPTWVTVWKEIILRVHGDQTVCVNVFTYIKLLLF